MIRINYLKKKIAQIIVLGCFTALSAAVSACHPGKETENQATAALRRQEISQQNIPVSIADLLTYEICADQGREYAVLTGIKEEYQEGFSKYPSTALEKQFDTAELSMPDEINGLSVEEIAADAFREIGVEVAHLPRHLRIVGDRAFLNTKLCEQEIVFSKEIEQIGEEAFANCGISRIEFPGEKNPTIGKRAFADNESLWAVYLPTADCSIGEGAFEGCEEKCYLGYKERMESGRSPAEDYADANGLIALWVPVIDSLEPIVRYPKTPLVLKPEVGEFFYGENGDGDLCLSMEEADDAPDYGFGAWHAPCGEWCVGEGFLEITASSELASADDRYAAKNLHALSGRENAWAEGVEGAGIGESITYHDCNEWHVNNRWEYLGYEEWYRKYENMENPLDGYIRYTTVCIVNGYARDQKSWEENGRVKTMLMYVEDEPYAYLELEDTIMPQYFALPWEDIMVADGGEITFRFVIEDVYPGAVYEDTCLTGLVVEFTGRHGH